MKISPALASTLALRLLHLILERIIDGVQAPTATVRYKDCWTLVTLVANS